MNLVIGKPYVIAGEGEMLLGEIHPNGNLRFNSHGGSGFGGVWVGPKLVVRQATRADLDARYAQAKPRGVACDDPECWCRRVL